MTESYKVEPAALTTAGAAFTDMVDDVNTASTTAQQLAFGSGNAGKGYSAQGSAYQSSIQKLVTTLLSPMAAKATWVGVTLNSSAQHYSQQESHAKSGIQTAGQGA